MLIESQRHDQFHNKMFFGNVRFYYCWMHPGGHFLFLRGRAGCHRNSRGYENVRGLSFKCNQCHENHFPPKFKLHWFKLYPLIIDTQSWQFWSWSFIYMTNFQYIYIYIYMFNLSMKEGSLFCFVLQLWDPPNGAASDCVLGVFGKLLIRRGAWAWCKSSWILNDSSTEN